MGDAPACGHPVHLSRPDELLHRGGIAVHDLAREYIGDGAQPDVRMRPHIGFARQAPGELDRPHVVEENEWPDHAAPAGRQQASHLEAADTAPPLIDYLLDHCLDSQTPCIPHPLPAVSMRTPTEKRTGLPRLSGSPLSKETTSAPGAPPVGSITRKESLCHDRCRTRKSNRQGAEAQRAAPRQSARPATGARAAWRGH